MFHRAAPFIRRSGMILELVGVIGVLSDRGNPDPKHIDLPGLGSISIAWLAVFCGFLIWLVGTILNVSNRSGQARRTGKSDPSAHAENQF